MNQPPMTREEIQAKRKKMSLGCGIVILLLDCLLLKSNGFRFSLYSALALVAGALLVLKSFASDEAKRK